VERNLLSNGVGGREVSWNVVVSESNANVLSNITGVHHISAGYWNLYLEALAIIRDLFNDEAHLLSAVTNLLDIKTQPEGSVNVVKLNIELTSLQIWVNLGFAGSFVEHLNLFNGELVLTLTVAGELACQNCKAHLYLVQISACNLNENVLCIVGDLGCFRVDDGRKRQDLALSIIEDWVLGLSLNDV